MHRQARMLEMVYADGESHRLSCEFLRVYSPSAEVTGHGPGQEVLQVGKEAVTITGIEPVGNYGIKLVFSDGHDTGIYDWEYLYRLGVDQARLWQTYLERLEAAGHQRQG
nr:DUF971 domain-containing protein [Ectothiorhodospira shaposhnikovii]